LRSLDEPSSFRKTLKSRLDEVRGFQVRGSEMFRCGTWANGWRCLLASFTALPDRICKIPGRMDRSRNWLIRILAWRARQPAEVSWFAASGLFLAALVARILAGPMYGANPALVFYPPILIAAAILGWKEAAAILMLSVAVGTYLFVRPDMYLMPLVWLTVGGLNIALLAGLQHVARELIALGEHRQATSGDIRAGGPAFAAPTQCDAVDRWVSADRVGSLEEASERGVATIVDLSAADLSISVEPSNLAFDRLRVNTTLVVTAGDQVQERVFRNSEGAKLTFSLRAIDSGRPVLTIVNYGPQPPPELTAPEGSAVAAETKA